MEIDFTKYKDKGIYIICEDKTEIDLTRDNITEKTRSFWSDPDKLPDGVKSAAGFKRCSICPKRDDPEFCDALRPVIPFLDVVGKYVSVDKVTAIYVGEDSNLYNIADTTMQYALQYVTILGLVDYCALGGKYKRYYYGIMPLDSGDEVAKRLFLNIFWFLDGNKDEVKKEITRFNDELRIIASNQVRRLGLICSKDAFNNAFIDMHVATDILNFEIDKYLNKDIKDLMPVS